MHTPMHPKPHSTDKRKPTVNAYGKSYGSTEESAEYFPVLDPQTNTATKVKMPAALVMPP